MNNNKVDSGDGGRVMVESVVYNAFIYVKEYEFTKQNRDWNLRNGSGIEIYEADSKQNRNRKRNLRCGNGIYETDRCCSRLKQKYLK